MKKKLTFWLKFLAVVIAMYLCVNAYNYKTNLKYYSKPPSDKWAKGKYIDTVNPSINSKIISDGKNYIVTINDKENIKIYKTNKMGEVLKKKSIKCETDILNDLFISKINDRKYYLQWSCTTLDGATIKNVFLDENFNEISKRQEENVQESFKLDEGLVVFGFKDRLEVKDLNKNKSYSIKGDKPRFISGIKSKNKDYFITYRNKNFEMIKLKFKDGKFIQNEKLGHIIEVGMESTLDIKLVSNLKENYFIVQTMAKGEPNNIFIKVDLDSNKMGDSKGLRLNEVMELNDIEFYKVENDKIYFLANSNRMTLLDGVCNDIIEFYIRDGKPVFDSILSKTKNTKIFHYGLDDIVTYATLNTDNEKYELNFTSSDISFKVKNNGIRDSEIQYAITKVIEADFYGSCCLLVSAFKWLIPVFVVICFFTAFQEKIKEKYRKKAFLILILISIIFKLINNYSVIYSRTWIYIPKPINNPLIGSIVAIFSSIIIYSFAYIEYKKDTEKLFIGAMAPFAMADMIITSTLYVQYII
ncbi:hypothetical protein [Hathewaya limosa]|uniref:DUF5050 domain-containing protein n=1 Tax=Hathewaya limosa TaxID=1536 RepID=A0ABU0JTD4_HATLI|nr:hypothetical protein [Hathewaya limosa]MDQ0480367.1 hypothetical protein [Hathewaya limosa]